METKEIKQQDKPLIKLDPLKCWRQVDPSFLDNFVSDDEVIDNKLHEISRRIIRRKILHDSPKYRENVVLELNICRPPSTTPPDSKWIEECDDAIERNYALDPSLGDVPIWYYTELRKPGEDAGDYLERLRVAAAQIPEETGANEAATKYLMQMPARDRDELVKLNLIRAIERYASRPNVQEGLRKCLKIVEDREKLLEMAKVYRELTSDIKEPRTLSMIAEFL